MCSSDLGIAKAVQHLLALGHTRIGFMGRVGRDPGNSYVGFTGALIQANVAPNERWTLDLATDQPEVARPPIRRYLRQAELPTAVVAQTDATAIGVLRAARELGICVPRDLSVIGYNDEAEAELADPPLTTMSNQRVLLGRTGVEMVLAAASGAYDAPQSRVLQCPLVERQSTAPPAARRGRKER